MDIQVKRITNGFIVTYTVIEVGRGGTGTTVAKQVIFEEQPTEEGNAKENNYWKLVNWIRDYYRELYLDKNIDDTEKA